MPVDSNRFGSQSKMSSSGSGGSSTGSCTSVAESDQKSGGSSSGICSSVDGGGDKSLVIAGDDFDAAIEESMEMLEKNAPEDSDDEVELRHLRLSRRSNSASSGSSSGATTPSTEEETYNVPPLTEEDIDKKLAMFNQNIQTRSPEGAGRPNSHHVSFPMPTPPPLPSIRFDRYSVVGVARRRLSQCKEEDGEEEETGAVNSALLAISSMKKSTSLNTDTTTGLFDDEDERMLEEKESKLIEEIKAPVSSRFTVTKTEHKEKENGESEKENNEDQKPKPPRLTQLRSGVEAMLRNSSAKQNSQTIHFPCSTPVNQNRLSVQTMFEPHLDKRYFDSSLVEIRSMNDSTQTVNLDSMLNDSVDAGGEGGANDIWVKRSEKPTDVSLQRDGG